MIQILGAETLDLLREEMPMRRFGTPEEVASSVLHLAQAEYITGQVLTVDGGFIR
jgi:3-oxoacyl-[acyl-carrier protein] reductase